MENLTLPVTTYLLSNQGNAIEKEATLARAKLAFVEERFAETEDICRLLLTEDPEFAPAWALLSDLAQRLDDFELAAELMNHALTLEPKQPEYWSHLGYIGIGKKDWDGAYLAFLRAVEFRPDFADAWLGQALVYVQRVEVQQAEYALKQALLHAREQNEIESIQLKYAEFSRTRSLNIRDAGGLLGLPQLAAERSVVPVAIPLVKSSHAYTFYIDICGTCNLACPSCPKGNWEKTEERVVKFMSLETMDAICRKAKSECTVTSFALYYWTEPLLHPQIAEMVKLVKSHGITCAVSSNLNVLRDAEAILRAEPDWLRVSVSGFTQETYGSTHRRGQIDKVKSNMTKLAAAQKKVGSKCSLELYYHRYLHNLDEEELMKAFAESLGFAFKTDWAIFMPIEKRLTYLNPKLKLAELSSEDLEIVSRLALQPEPAKKYALSLNYKKCAIRDDFVVLDVNAEAHLCCGTFKSKIASYVSTPLAEIQKLRSKHSLCGPCIAQGVNALNSVAANAKLDEIAWTHINKTRAAAAEKVKQRQLDGVQGQVPEVVLST